MDVVAAYEILGDPDKRAAFDDMGGSEQARAPPPSPRTQAQRRARGAPPRARRLCGGCAAGLRRALPGPSGPGPTRPGHAILNGAR